MFQPSFLICLCISGRPLFCFVFRGFHVCLMSFVYNFAAIHVFPNQKGLVKSLREVFPMISTKRGVFGLDEHIQFVIVWQIRTISAEGDVEIFFYLVFSSFWDPKSTVEIYLLTYGIFYAYLDGFRKRMRNSIVQHLINSKKFDKTTKEK